MAYVRKHGNQVAVVRGARDKETGKVRQQVPFSLYSRELQFPEFAEQMAREIAPTLKRGNGKGPE